MNQAIQTKCGFSLQQKGLFLFAVTMLLTLLLAVALYGELAGISDAGQAAADTATGSSPGVKSQSLIALSNPLFLLISFSGLIVMLVTCLLFFLRGIVAPLQEIDSATQRMVNGRLDRHVNISNQGEFGRTGELVNDLAINLQEVLLLFWNHAKTNDELIERFEKSMVEHPGDTEVKLFAEEIIAQLKQGNNDVKSIVSAYDFFNLKLEKEKIVIEPQ